MRSRDDGIAIGRIVGDQVRKVKDAPNQIAVEIFAPAGNECQDKRLDEILAQNRVMRDPAVRYLPQMLDSSFI